LTTRGRGKYRRASWARCCSCLEAPKVDRDHRPAPICQMHLIRVGPYIVLSRLSSKFDPIYYI
jgi:hypothetical protein